MMPKPVAHYTLDEATPYDHSGNGYTGTKNGNISTGANGVLGTNCYDFDGSDDGVDISDIGNITAPTSVTVWAKKDSTASGKRIFDHDKNVYHIGYEVRGSNGFEFNCYDGSHHTITSGNTTTGTWQFFTSVLHTDGSMEFYINSKLQGTTSIGTLSEFKTKTGIGFNAKGLSEYFDGDIDEVRIYDRALTPAGVQYLYEVGKRGHQRTSEKVS